MLKSWCNCKLILELVEQVKQETGDETQTRETVLKKYRLKAFVYTPFIIGCMLCRTTVSVM